MVGGCLCECVEDVLRKRWKVVVGVKRPCNTVDYLEDSVVLSGVCTGRQVVSLVSVSVSEEEEGDEKGRKERQHVSSTWPLGSRIRDRQVQKWLGKVGG